MCLSCFAVFDFGERHANSDITSGESPLQERPFVTIYDFNQASTHGARRAAMSAANHAAKAPAITSKV